MPLELRECLGPHCHAELPATGQQRSTCSHRCRQALYRLRRLVVTEAAAARPLTMVYADPPFPGMAHYYRGEDSYGGEVDHPALIASLLQARDGGAIAGWALSTSAVRRPRSMPFILAT